MPNTIYSVGTDIGTTLFLGNNYGYSQPQVFARTGWGQTDMGSGEWRGTTR